MVKLFQLYVTDTKGALLPVAAVMFPVILGMAGLGIDTTQWMMERRNLQNAADAAAIAAAWEVANGYYDTYETTGLREAEKNGYDPSADGSDLDVALTTAEDGSLRVTANLTSPARLWLSNLLFDGDVRLANAAATAIIEPTGNYCILSLDEDADSAISADGTADVIAAGCGLAVNSNSENALGFGGNVTVDVGDVSIVGGHDVGNNVDFTYSSMRTNARPVPDPYRDLDVPSCGGCTTFNNQRVNGGGNLTPGIYRGGLTISGNGTVNFAPGVYIIDGGDFRVTGNGAMVGEGVTFILTNSGNGSVGNINISGGKTVTFSAPAEGDDMEGILIYQDRNASASNQGNSFTGTAALNIDGVIYTPSRSLDFGGNNTSESDTCTKLIANTVRFHGTPGLGTNCEDRDEIEDIGIPSVRLVL